MAIQTRDYLKGQFMTNDHPTQADFRDLIDSMMLVSDDVVCHNDEVVVHNDEIVTLT